MLTAGAMRRKRRQEKPSKSGAAKVLSLLAGIGILDLGVESLTTVQFTSIFDPSLT